MRHRSIALAAAFVIVVIGALVLVRKPPATRPRSRPPAAVPRAQVREESPTSEPRAAPPSLPAEVSAPAPPGCPDDEEDDPQGFVRPSLWELLRLRTWELRDRLPQLSRDASPALREGLEALPDPRAIDALIDAPDRVRDGFDVALAALLTIAMRAIGDDDVATALRLTERAIRIAPDDPAAYVAAAVAAFGRNDSRDARERLRSAFALAPDEPAIALEFARTLVDHAEDARPVLAAYLRAVPEDRRTRRWAERIEARSDELSTFARREHDGIVIAWPLRAVERARIDQLDQQVRATLQEAGRVFGRAPRAELAVIVYADLAAMRRTTCAPAWSGGMFDGVLHLDAETLRADQWARPVRHETTHAQLALLRRRLPLWLEEGIAQWIEGPPRPQSEARWRSMVERRTCIPFASLEGSLLVIEDASDAQLAYHQSLAMVRLLIDRRGERAIADALTAVENDADPMRHALGGAEADCTMLLAFLRRTHGG